MRPGVLLGGGLEVSAPTGPAARAGRDRVGKSQVVHGRHAVPEAIAEPGVPDVNYERGCHRDSPSSTRPSSCLTHLRAIAFPSSLGNRLDSVYDRSQLGQSAQLIPGSLRSSAPRRSSRRVRRGHGRLIRSGEPVGRSPGSVTAKGGSSPRRAAPLAFVPAFALQRGGDHVVGPKGYMWTRCWGCR
jgi:hypothetical protein